ncbi:hypothetical protein [Zophobihabitans entericus]|uniref:Uncharacterized protein n=1 Tax=Zophobihabitans entericus TaxID=1635327 RepID=A0A6G9I7L7_9GAMM|nr:hypothetical protein [Zophobihabitans entericus]QIQ20203.1 hypothetical protein IPMB12_06975 [Zophobihabitans entericus]
MSSLQIPQGCIEYPDTEELIDQCHALAGAIDESDEQQSKDILFTLLKEKITVLRSCYLVEMNKLEQEWLDSTSGRCS